MAKKEEELLGADIGAEGEKLLGADSKVKGEDLLISDTEEKGKRSQTKNYPKKEERLLGAARAPVKDIKICFDTTQNERGKLAENYKVFKELVEKKGYITESNLEFPITFTQLTHYDIVFFACPDRSKIREFELNEILKYVKCGGALVVLASSGGDKGRMTNLNDLCSKFGILFNNDQVFDDQHNYGIRNLAISTVFADHALTDGLELVIIPSSCSLSLSGKAVGIVFSDEDADPPDMPVIAASEYGEGRVVVLGSYDTFRDNIRAGIQVIQHRILLENILYWVLKDKPLAQILFALPTLKIREKKVAKKAPPLYSSSLPSTAGRVSPEALLDQVLTNLQQVRSVGEKLENINVHLVEVAMEIKKLNERLSFAEDLRIDLKKIQKDLVISKLDDKLKGMDKKFSDFSKKVDKSLTTILKKLAQTPD